jgi:hypothetical protein
VTDPDRISRIRATYEKGARRGLHDASEVAYLMKSWRYVFELLDGREERREQLELFTLSIQAKGQSK